MITLAAANVILLLIALIIGVVTGWWAWAGRAYVPIASGFDTGRAPSPTLARVAVPEPAFKPVTAAFDPLMAAEPLVPASATVAPTVSAPAIAPAVGAPDDLLQLKGVGPKLAGLLNSLGVTRFDQIAAWGPSDIAEVDKHLASFSGRVVRDQWVEQAGLLARGDIAGFEAKFGKLDSENA